MFWKVYVVWLPLLKQTKLYIYSLNIFFQGKFFWKFVVYTSNKDFRIYMYFVSWKSFLRTCIVRNYYKLHFPACQCFKSIWFSFIKLPEYLYLFFFNPHFDMRIKCGLDTDGMRVMCGWCADYGSEPSRCMYTVCWQPANHTATTNNQKKGFVVAKNQLILIFDWLSAGISSHIVTMLHSLMYVLK